MHLPRPEPGPDDETVRIGDDAGRPVPPPPHPPYPTARAYPPPYPGAHADPPPHPAGRFDEDDAASATFLDPTVWSTGGPERTVPAPRGAAGPAGPPADRPRDAPPPADAPGELRRFGPGVPPRAAEAWHGTADRKRRERRRRAMRWLVPAAVLIALLALLTRCRSEPPLEVTGVTVAADPADGPPCGGTAVLKAAVTTNGHPGTVRYRWLRSDGTASAELSQPVRPGERRTELVLRWTFDGPGTMRATATVEILAPGRHSAAASFTYTCPR